MVVRPQRVVGSCVCRAGARHLGGHQTPADPRARRQMVGRGSAPPEVLPRWQAAFSISPRQDQSVSATGRPRSMAHPSHVHLGRNVQLEMLENFLSLLLS